MPAELPESVLAECARVAVAAHEALGLRDLSRSDLVVGDDGTVTFLEVNVAPGFTETSLVPLSVEAAGLDLGEVLASLVRAASARDARTREPLRAARDRAGLPAIIAAAKIGFRALGQRISMTGLEHLPRIGGALVAVNHVSYVDFIYGGLPVERIGRLPRFMAKRELFDHRVTGPIMRALRHIEVDRADGERSLPVALDYLSRGEVVGIFPEATISRAMEIKELKTGAARIAHAADVPLVPVVVWGTQRLMTKDHPRDFSRGKAITVTVGPPVPADGRRPRRHRGAAGGSQRAARRGDPRLPAAPARRLVGAGLARRHRADARGGGASWTPTRRAAQSTLDGPLSRLISQSRMSTCCFVALSTFRSFAAGQRPRSGGRSGCAGP